MFVFAGPCLLFPTCSNRLQGGSNQVFIARLQAFSLPHDRPRRFARQESGVHNKQEELTHEGMQGFVDTLDSSSELQSCHLSNGERQAKKGLRKSTPRSFGIHVVAKE